MDPETGVTGESDFERDLSLSVELKSKVNCEAGLGRCLLEVSNPVLRFPFGSGLEKFLIEDSLSFVRFSLCTGLEICLLEESSTFDRVLLCSCGSGGDSFREKGSSLL